MEAIDRPKSFSRGPVVSNCPRNPRKAFVSEGSPSPRLFQ